MNGCGFDWNSPSGRKRLDGSSPGIKTIIFGVVVCMLAILNVLVWWAFLG